MENIKWRYYIFYVCFLAFEIVFLYFMVIETRYVPIEEIARHFDGADADITDVAKGKLEEDGLVQDDAVVRDVHEKQKGGLVAVHGASAGQYAT